MGDNMEDDDWTPMTAAELKIIEARHERSNQISKLMGQYMLKGYRMLDKICSCGTILLQDRSGVDYCVACSELESECAKDDPALSPAAARVAAMEGQAMTSDSNVSQQRMALYQAEASAAASSSMSRQPEPSGQGDAATRSEAVAESHTTCTATLPAETDRRTTCVANSSAATQLQDQIEMAAKELRNCTSIEMKIQLCNLVKAASEALIAMRNAGISD